MKNLIHFGCSFAVGNGIPKYLIGLDSGKRSRAQRKIDFKERYGVSMEQQTSSGNLIASRLGLRFIRIAENGASNEMVARKLLQTKIEKHFVLIGITSGNRREALTTGLSNTHWHTWKMIGPDQPRCTKTSHLSLHGQIRKQRTTNLQLKRMHRQEQQYRYFTCSPSSNQKIFVTLCSMPCTMGLINH